MFLNKLADVEEVCLIGKQFKSTDQDIAEDITRVCRQTTQKNVVFVNPESSNSEWVNYHKDIFNAKSHICFKSLEAYANHFYNEDIKL